MIPISSNSIQNAAVYNIFATHGKHEPLQLGWWHVDEGRCSATCTPFWTITRANTDRQPTIFKSGKWLKTSSSSGPASLLLGLPIVFFAWTLVQQFCLWYMLIQHSTIYPVFIFWKCFKNNFILFLNFFNFFISFLFADVKT